MDQRIRVRSPSNTPCDVGRTVRRRPVEAVQTGSTPVHRARPVAKWSRQRSDTPRASVRLRSGQPCILFVRGMLLRVAPQKKSLPLGAGHHPKNCPPSLPSSTVERRLETPEARGSSPRDGTAGRARWPTGAHNPKRRIVTDPAPLDGSAGWSARGLENRYSG